MKKTLSFSLIAFLCFCFIVSSCKKDEAKYSGQAQFSISGLKSSLKSGVADTLNLSYVLFTITDASGNVVKNSEKVELYNMNGDYISKPVSLVKGSYKLTGFMVLDSKNNIVYASPIKGSAKAYLVQEPLPISFDILRNGVTKLTPEVISTENSKPEDFGYVTFGLDIVKTFDFLIGTFIYNDTFKNFELTSANISVFSDTTKYYTGQLNALQNGSSGIVSIYDSIGVTNKITLSEKYDHYTLVISKDGYKTYSQTFTKAELKLHFKSTDKGPLVVILEKSTLNDGLVAYYKFNGDVKDYSGNNNNGIYNGRGYYTVGRHAESMAAVDFNGTSDYISVKNAVSLNPDQITICAWYYAISFYGNGANSLVTKMKNLSPVEYQYHLNVLSDSYGGNPSDVHMRQFGFNLTTDQGAYPVTTTGTGDFSYKYYQYNLYEWNFIVGTYNGDSLKLYVNGDLKAWRAAKGEILQTTNDVYIGGQGYFRPSYDFTGGKIDEVRIYNRSLSQAEIISLYQN